MKEVSFVVPVVLTQTMLIEAIAEGFVEYEELLGLIKQIDLEVVQDFEFTEMCAKYFVNEMAKLKAEEPSYWGYFKEFLQSTTKED